METVTSIRKGTCILTEQPFVYALKSRYRQERCDFCFTERKVLKCSNCSYVYYCNQKCQKEAWPIHKTECLFLRKIAPRTLPDAARVLARIILKLSNGGEHQKGYYTDTRYRQFKDLMTHYDELKNDEKRLEHIESLSSVLQQLLGNELLPNPTEFIKIYGRMLVNAFNILDEEMNSIGTGIYLGVSIIDHSCTPNAVATFERTTIFIHVTEDLPNLEWSKIFISYVDLLSATEDRRSELQNNYFFFCDCSRCSNNANDKVEANAAACPSCGKCVNVHDLQYGDACSNCKVQITQDQLDQYFEVVDVTKMHLDKMKDFAYFDVCEFLLKLQRNVLYSMNVWHLKTLDYAFESAINVSKWDAAIKYGKELVPGFSKYCGKHNPLLGLIYMKLGKILLHRSKQKEALDNLNKACDIIRITHGEDHSLFRNQLIPLLMDASIE
ncbi:Histone-lysine N-methyltransferase SMYD3 [Pseudolycoriella hygida]|uniref:Histone-lysine N-methyltransferase SMYD3 n=1 Tax=Pseudolycoriella hygida TaxID=35572 RepID=A0A9Q0RW90_9DIPT|nr:Histone-lysine N-methyltransferase SMYD3 [Pseudolycoriella hygida]